MTIDDLLAAAETIKTENGVRKNTSTRVGVLFANMINYFGTNISTETQALIDEAVKKYTSGVRKGMTVQFDPGLPLPVGFVFANGNGGVKINGVTIPDWRGRVPVGFDPLSALTPANADKSVKNYGKVGNTGGVTGIKLTGKQSGVQSHDHDVLVFKGKYDGTGSQEGVKPGGTIKFKTDKSGYKDAEESFDNRMEYGVAYWITKFSDDYTAEYNSAYHSYLDTTTDNPKLTEADWVAALKGDKGDKGIDGIIGSNGQDGTSVPVNISIFKTGANGITLPQKFKWINDITVTSVELMDNCSGISVTIGATTYNEITLVGVTIPAGTQLIINDLTIVAGETNANAIIIC